jgi:inhibitor of cysteine peptidase
MHMKRFFIAIASVALILPPLGGIRAGTLSHGDLIKASGPAVYYYHSDGTRLVFPNEKTYFTWYDDFSDVKTITDGELAAIEIGGNVTYRPGVKMVKIQTDPRVYAVGMNRELRWIQTEALAAELYGESWAAMVDDVPDAFFVDYAQGTVVSSASDFDPAAMRDANASVADTREPASETETVTESLEKTVGDAFTITLDSNPSTGYSWAAEYDENYLSLTSSTYESNADPELVGAGGRERFEFKAIKAGETEITLSYRRPWEEGVEPIKRHISRVTIREAETAEISVTITPNKTEAQANESIDFLAQTDYDGMIDAFEILVDGALYKSCAGAKTCAASWTVPTAGTASSYQAVARLRTLDDGILESSVTIPIVTIQPHASINVILERETVKPSQAAAIKIQIEAGLNARKIEIYIDGQAKRICTSNPTSCRYDDYVHGDIGSTHEVYAKVQTPAYLWYESGKKVMTIAENDSPRITVVTGMSEILPTATVDVTATANDDDGIAYVEILKDGEVLAHCIGATPCTAYAGPFDLPSGSTVTFDAVAADLKGLASTSTGAASVMIK